MTESNSYDKKKFEQKSKPQLLKCFKKINSKNSDLLAKQESKIQTIISTVY